MEKETIIFWRNFLLRNFLIGILFAILFFVVFMVFWDTWETWTAQLFGTDKEAFGEISLSFFMNVRLVLVFLVLCPAIAFHLMSKKAK